VREEESGSRAAIHIHTASSLVAAPSIVTTQSEREKEGQQLRDLRALLWSRSLRLLQQDGARGGAAGLAIDTAQWS
jgi:hypothetical protein